MANSRRRRTSRPSGRDHSPIASSPARVDSFDTLATLLLAPPRTPLIDLVPAPLQLLEDRRRFHPDPLEPIRTAPAGRPARVVVLPPRSIPANRSWRVLEPSPPVRVAFEQPDQTPVCIRRETRRQVIHAAGHAGKSVRPPRYTRTSSVSCRKR